MGLLCVEAVCGLPAGLRPPNASNAERSPGGRPRRSLCQNRMKKHSPGPNPDVRTVGSRRRPRRKGEREGAGASLAER